MMKGIYDLRFTICAALMSGMLLAARAALPAQVNFAWTANTETNLAGYRLYHGPAPGFYTNAIRLGLVTSYGMAMSGKQYFALAAFDTRNFESALTPELVFDPPATPRGFDFSDVRLVTEESCDFVLWEPVFTNAVPALFPLAFFRLRADNVYNITGRSATGATATGATR